MLSRRGLAGEAAPGDAGVTRGVAGGDSGADGGGENGWGGWDGGGVGTGPGGVSGEGVNNSPTLPGAGIWGGWRISSARRMEENEHSASSARTSGRKWTAVAMSCFLPNDDKPISLSAGGANKS